MSANEKEACELYEGYYKKNGTDRNDLLSNPEVLFQHLAFEESIICALRRATNLSVDLARILDVGCGSGSSLAKFLELGFAPTNLHGIDLIEERIVKGKRKFPNINFLHGDATKIPFVDGYFDLVLESTIFVQMTDQLLAGRIAAEMIRVVAPGGYMLVIDWRYGKPWDKSYLGVSPHRIRQMFSVGEKVDLVCQTRGALIPPIGRLVSKYIPSIYFLLRAIFPFLAGSTVTLLRKRRLDS